MAEDNLQTQAVPQAEPQGRLIESADQKAKKVKTAEMALLMVLCLMTVGFLIYRGTSAGKAHDATPGPGAQRQTIVPPPARGPEAAEESAPLHVAGCAPTGRRDPFEPMILARDESARAFTPPPRIRGGNPFSSFGAVLPAPINQQLPTLPKPGSQSQVQAQTPEANPAAELVVTGILCGNPNVAIVRDKGNGRHYVRVGDKIGDRLTVLSIERGRILLQADGKNVVLMLGGKKDAS